MKFIYCRRLNSQYFRAPNSGASKKRPPHPPAVAGIAGGFYAIALLPTYLAVTCWCGCTQQIYKILKLLNLYFFLILTWLGWGRGALPPLDPLVAHLTETIILESFDW